MKIKLKKAHISFFNDRTKSQNSGEGNMLKNLYSVCHATDNYYKMLNSLIDNTVVYLSNVCNEISTTDKQIANTFKE